MIHTWSLRFEGGRRRTRGTHACSGNSRFRERVPRRAIRALAGPFDAVRAAFRTDVGFFQLRH